MAEETALKMADFQLLRARDLDLGSGHNAYHRASLIDLYLRAKFHWNRRNFLWTDGRTDEHLKPALLGRLCRRVDLKRRKSEILWPVYALPVTKPTVSKRCVYLKATTKKRTGNFGGRPTIWGVCPAHSKAMYAMYDKGMKMKHETAKMTTIYLILCSRSMASRYESLTSAFTNTTTHYDQSF